MGAERAAAACWSPRSGSRRGSSSGRPLSPRGAAGGRRVVRAAVGVRSHDPARDAPGRGRGVGRRAWQGRGLGGALWARRAREEYLRLVHGRTATRNPTMLHRFERPAPSASRRPTARCSSARRSCPSRPTPRNRRRTPPPRARSTSVTAPRGRRHDRRAAPSGRVSGDHPGVLCHRRARRSDRLSARGTCPSGTASIEIERAPRPERPRSAGITATPPVGFEPTTCGLEVADVQVFSAVIGRFYCREWG